MKRNGRGSKVVLDTRRESLVTHAGALLILETIKRTGLDSELALALAPWRPGNGTGRGMRHDPGKIVVDLAIALALGGDCAADLAAVRAQPVLFGPVASDPTVSRLIGVLGADADTTAAVVAALRTARSNARERGWAQRRPLPGTPGTRDGGQVIIDLDATLVTAYSDKDQAAGTFKRGYGFHPMCAFLDHGDVGTGEVLAINLRPGNANANTATDLITALDDALAQLPEHERGQVLVRVDGAGGTKEFLHHVAGLGLEYSVGIGIHTGIKTALDTLPDHAWHDVIGKDGEPDDWAQVADLTDLIPAPTGKGTSHLRNPLPPGMRVIARRVQRLPGTQLEFDDHDGWRITCFATNTPLSDQDSAGGHDRDGWTLPELDLRQRQRARGEDRIRNAKDTGLRNLPYQSFDRNQIWVEILTLATDLLTWTQILAFEPGTPPRRWEPKTFRFRILTVAGRIVRTSRQQRLRLPRNWPWNQILYDGYTALVT